MATSETIVLDPIVPMFAPTLYWALDSENGVTDLSGNSNDGTANGSPTVGGSSEAPPGFNTTTDLDGSDDFFTTTYDPFVDATVRTYAGWGYRDSDTNPSGLFGGDTNGGPDLRISASSNDVALFMSHNTLDATWSGAWSGNAQWVHWALVIDESNDTADLYINAAHQGQKTVTPGYGGGDILFGAGEENGSPFDGKIAHIAVYERGLTIGEIGSLYWRGATQLHNRTQLEVTPWVDHAGVDWGDAQIQAFMAEQERGSSPVDFRLPNRVVSIPFIFAQTSGSTTAKQAREQVTAKAALWQREGGRIKRTTNAGGIVYLDVVNATLRATSVTGLQSEQEVDLGAELTLECIPDAYEDLVDLGDATETTEAELVTTYTSVDGNMPGRFVGILDEDDAEDQRGCFGGFRSRHYSAESSAALEFEAEDLEALDQAATAVLSGASGGSVMEHTDLGADWTPVFGTNVGGTTWLTHTGNYRVWIRALSADGDDVDVRFVYGIGDLVNVEQNDSVTLYHAGTASTDLQLLDLGTIHLPQAPAHRWQGQVQARGASGGESIQIDKIWFQPLEVSWKLRAPISLQPNLGTYSARSEFTTESGAITSDSLAVGGTWTGAGDAGDFSVSGGEATRTTVSDASGIENGRLITASDPTSLTDTLVRVDFKVSTHTEAMSPGVLARYTDANNFAAAFLDKEEIGNNDATLTLVKRVSSSTTTLNTKNVVAVMPTATWLSLYLWIDASGRMIAWVGSQGAATTALTSLADVDSDLATGGTLASGTVGIVDHHTASESSTRTYDNFGAWAPTDDAVVFASQSAHLRWDGFFRDESGGEGLGKISDVRGSDLPRIPVSGKEGRTVELLTKLSRGDLTNLPDDGQDDLSLRAFYHPSWLFVDET